MRICAQIDLGALQNNLQQVRRLAPHSQVLAMVKANAYGHGLVPCAQNLQADYLGVATLEEALLLRQAGVEKRIVLMGGVADALSLQVVAAQQLDLVVYDALHLDLLAQYRGTYSIPIWFKVNTGMHRLGFLGGVAEPALQRLEQMHQVHIQAVMTHLAVADEPAHDHTHAQLEAFTHLTRQWAYPKSVVNSAGLLRYPDFHFEIVRPGLMLYGLSPCADIVAESIGIVPVMSLTATVLTVFEIPAGHAIGYGLDWTADRPSKIAVISAGYGDGYPQYPRGNPQVKVHDALCPVVGRVSMDFMMIDATDCPLIAANDPAILWDRTHKVACPYAYLTGVMARVPRVFLESSGRR